MRIFRSDGLTARSIYKTPTSVQYDTDKRIEFRITKFPGSQAHRQWNFKIYKATRIIQNLAINQNHM